MTQHISVRVPWKDNGYTGFVCDKPCYNNSCLRLKNISENRDDEHEKHLAGKPMAGHEMDLPCISEGGAFMSQTSLTRINIHPYKTGKNKEYSHFLETELVYPPFTLPARPFRWLMLKKDNIKNIDRLVETYNIAYDYDKEPELADWNNWVQHADNHRSIFETFYRHVQPNKSLTIPYAKQVPFIEDAKRIVMGIGYVEQIIQPPEHNHTDNGEMRSLLWETMIGHSIRDERTNGFLLPYHEMMAYADEHPGFDIRSITVFAEDDYFNEFSYATEQLSYDAVISVLLQAIKALGIIKQCISGNWDECIKWCNARLIEVWKDRGAYPGAGIMLQAMGFKKGILIAEEVKNSLTDDESFIKKLELAIETPEKYLPVEIATSISGTEKTAFIKLNTERKALFRLLSRFSLTPIQANAVFHRDYTYYTKTGKEKHTKIDLNYSDAKILENPYIVYEATRVLNSDCKIPLRNADMAAFPPKEIREKEPLPEPSLIPTENDWRRIRAIAVSILEKQIDYGNTVYSQEMLATAINELPLEPHCSVTKDILDSLGGSFDPEFESVKMKNGDTAYQLSRMKKFDDVIRNSVEKRIKAARHQIDEDWMKIVNNAFGNENLEDEELRARQEKAAILKELAEARLSVLIGGAGTGKTTLLSLLCKSQKIQAGGILLLAPTGKARVRMSQTMQEQGVQFDAKTVAQFLLPNKRFDSLTMNYRLSEMEADGVPNTVIIDESSMLTTEMFGALLQAFKKNAQRIIFVGDPRQLPPIGAGRPFVDLVNHLSIEIKDFPRVGNCYGELTVVRRQQNTEDRALAEWYSNTDGELDNDIFARLQSNECGDGIALKIWETTEELEKLLLETVAQEIGMENIDDINNFNRSLGGNVGEKATYFNAGKTIADKWQILAPIRNQPNGILNLNYLFHNKYREQFMELANSGRTSIMPKPMGVERIVYGDKVINIINKERYGYSWDKKVGDYGYVANGEVGIAVRGFRDNLQVEFSTQKNISYRYKFGGEEGEVPLELAYALTVHKAQGSEFDTVILVIGEPCALLSRELLYTAITRQKNKLVILYNQEAYQLRNYSSMQYSDIARRFTCLFEKPEIVEYESKYYEANLIHKTARGELVRSKSEVIVADALNESGIHYAYEKELDLGKDGKRIPDFTIEDAESGITFYWEHCGMMNDFRYRSRWEEKKAIYAKHGIVEEKNLIVSQDDKNGSIDSQAIRALIKKYLT